MPRVFCLIIFCLLATRVSFAATSTLCSKITQATINSGSLLSVSGEEAKLSAFEMAVAAHHSANSSARLGLAEILGLGEDNVAQNVYAAARELLAERNVVFIPRMSEKVEGVSLEILPGDTSPLNRFAKNMRESYGVTVFYSPEQLTHFGAGYTQAERALYLPHEAIQINGPEVDTFHEVLHAKFHHMLRNGKGSLFHGGFVAMDKKPMWANENYATYMSLEEIATFPDSLSRRGLELREVLYGNSVQEKDRVTALKDTVRRVKALAEANATNNAVAHEFIRRGLERIKLRPEDLKISAEDITNEQGEKHRRFYATLHEGEHVFLFDVMFQSELTPEVRTLLMKRINEAKADLPQGQVIFDNFLRDAAIARLRQIDRVIVEGEKDARKIMSLGKGLADKKGLDGLIEATQKSKETVAPYHEWNLDLVKLLN